MTESRSNNNCVREATRSGNNNAWQTSNDDCWFFLHSSCTRDDCPFRHEPAAPTAWCAPTGKLASAPGGDASSDISREMAGREKVNASGRAGRGDVVSPSVPTSRAGGCCKPQCPYQHVKRHADGPKPSKLTSQPLLPASLPKMIKHQNLQNILVQFFQQYFEVYDSDNRQPLLDAYCENAVMSLHAVGSMDTMEAYIEHSRNLLRANEKQKRQLKIGRLQVVALHASLPGTRHRLESFTLDEPFRSENNVANVTLTGLFEEKNTGKIRHFNRAMAIVPVGSGLCILNEILFVTFPTKAQMESGSNYPVSSEGDSMM